MHVLSVECAPALHVLTYLCAVSGLFSLQIEEVNYTAFPIHFSLIAITKLTKQKIEEILQKCVDSYFCVGESRHGLVENKDMHIIGSWSWCDFSTKCSWVTGSMF